MNIEITRDVALARRKHDQGFSILAYSDYNDLMTQLNLVYDNQCQEIEAAGLGSGLLPTEYGSVLACLVKKMRHGARICLSGVDVYSVAETLLRNREVIEFNRLVFGSDGENRGINTLCDTTGLLRELGLDIEFCDIQKNEYTVIGRRK